MIFFFAVGLIDAISVFTDLSSLPSTDPRRAAVGSDRLNELLDLSRVSGGGS